MPWLFIAGEIRDNNAAMQSTGSDEGSLHNALSLAPAGNGDGLELAIKTEAQQDVSSLMQPPLPKGEPGPSPGTIGSFWQPALPDETPPVHGPMPESAASTLQIRQVCTVPCPMSLFPALSHTRQG